MSLEIRFSLPNQPPKRVPLAESRMLIGTLLSNDVVIRAAGVDPIHAMIEEDEQGHRVITDLGSETGVMVNDRKIDVETRLKAGDVIAIAGVVIQVVQEDPAAPVPPGAGEIAALPQTKATTNKSRATATNQPTRKTSTRASAQPDEVEDDDDTVSPLAPTMRAPDPRGPGAKERRVEKKDLLFSPRKARPSGHVLEVVSYWGDTILDVELFHPRMKGFEQVTIGDPTKAHLLAGGKKHITRHLFAEVSENGYRLRLLDDMEARIRKGGKVGTKTGQSSISLGRRDLAHVKHGAIRYFLMFVNPPPLALPRGRAKDPFFAMMITVTMLFYFIAVPLLWIAQPKPVDEQDDDVWTVVNVPENRKKPEPEVKPTPTPPPKPPQKVAENKTPPPVKPPPPQPKPVTPVQPKETPKPVQKEPVKQPVPKPVVQPNPAPPTPTPPKPQEQKAAGPTNRAKAPNKPDLSNKLSKAAGMPSTGSKKPDFKVAGPRNNRPLGKAGGAVGSGMGQRGGERKGNKAASTMGVEGVNNNKASGVNLSKLGLGAGKILNKTGPGAINTPFKNSAGGAGGGSGSASKTYGLGGVGSGSSLGIAGTGSQVGNWGSGSGGLGGGQGGAGGLGGAGLGSGFGAKGGGGGGSGGRANVTVPPGDPVVSGGLTAQEVQAVIRANLNQIRHCYEQLLQRSPNASGKIKVQFVVAPNGRVSSASIQSSDIADSMMKGCVTGKIQRWKFPQPRGGQPVTVSYPFVFNPL